MEEAGPQSAGGFLKGGIGEAKEKKGRGALQAEGVPWGKSERSECSR